MPDHRVNSTQIALAALLALSAVAPVCAQVPPSGSTTAAPDSGLYESYHFDRTFTSVLFQVCGLIEGSSGCFGAGDMTPFGRVGAVMEGNPVVDSATNTVTRDVYIFDKAVGGGTSTATELDIYRITIVVNAPTATVTFSRVASVPLPLVGGVASKTFMAGNAAFVYIGTDQSSFAMRVHKTGWATTQVNGYSAPVSSITTDAYGYVTVTYGGLLGSDGFHQYSPSGASLDKERGAQFELGTMQGLSTSHVLARTAAFAPDLTVHYARNPR